MFNLFRTKFNTGNHVIQSENMYEMAHVLKDKYNLAIWKRQPDENLASFVRLLISLNSLSITGRFSKAGLEETLTQQLVMMKGFPGYNHFIEDVAMLFDFFSNLCKTENASVTLGIIDHDACRKFHVDFYELRLLCSYIGPGTEWVYNNNVNRKYLGRGENEQIIRKNEEVQRLKAFEVCLLKGEAGINYGKPGIVHRSPPLQDSKDKRLVLRIDF